MTLPLPTLFVPHGAPTFALHPGTAGTALAATAARLPRPRAIVVISAHWDTAEPAIGSDAGLRTVPDSWGFPDALYNFFFPSRGDPALPDPMLTALADAGFAPQLVRHRGLDHGAWIPLRLMYPQADIPVVPLSLQSPLGPAHHLRLGRALAALAQDDVLVVASGNLTHNLRDYQLARRDATPPEYVGTFADWIAARLDTRDVDALLDYRQQAPEAVRAHPSEEHLLPLFVALGAAGNDWRAERLHSGIDDHVLAMDSYAFWPQQEEA